MCQAVLSPNLTKKFQWEVSQIADNRFPCVMLLGGLSVNLNHLINHFNNRFGTTVTSTKTDLPANAKFTKEQITAFTTSALFMGAHQLRINRQAILEKWKRKDIVYPTSPKELRNEKYR